LLSTLPRVTPNLTVGNGVNPDFISHDPKVAAAYKADPKVHDRVSARLARFIADAGPAVIERAPLWQVPTLLMYAGSDKLVNPRGSDAFAAAAPPRMLTARCFDGLYHEIFNEAQAEAEPVYETLRKWLDERCPAPVSPAAP